MPIVSALVKMRQKDFREFKPTRLHTKTMTQKERGAGKHPCHTQASINTQTGFIPMVTGELMGKC